MKLEKKEKNFYTSYSKLSEIKLITIGLASPERIKQWAEKTLPNGKILGEVVNANTLHHKTFKPQKGGLFCERIFGPLKDFECACASKMKFKKIALKAVPALNKSPLQALRLFSVATQQPKQGNEQLSFNYNSSLSTVLAKPTPCVLYQSNQKGKDFNTTKSIFGDIATKPRKFCNICEVEYTWSVMRRYQLGYIKLISPVTHVWYLKGNPSYLSILLDIKKRHLEYITYCSETLTIENVLKGRPKSSTKSSDIVSSWNKLKQQIIKSALRNKNDGFSYRIPPVDQKTRNQLNKASYSKVTQPSGFTYRIPSGSSNEQEDSNQLTKVLKKSTENNGDAIVNKNWSIFKNPPGSTKTFLKPSQQLIFKNKIEKRNSETIQQSAKKNKKYTASMSSFSFPFEKPGGFSSDCVLLPLFKKTLRVLLRTQPKRTLPLRVLLPKVRVFLPKVRGWLCKYRSLRDSPCVLLSHRGSTFASFEEPGGFASVRMRIRTEKKNPEGRTRRVGIARKQNTGGQPQGHKTLVSSKMTSCFLLFRRKQSVRKPGGFVFGTIPKVRADLLERKNNPALYYKDQIQYLKSYKAFSRKKTLRVLLAFCILRKRSNTFFSYRIPSVEIRNEKARALGRIQKSSIMLPNNIPWDMDSIASFFYSADLLVVIRTEKEQATLSLLRLFSLLWYKSNRKETQEESYRKQSTSYATTEGKGEPGGILCSKYYGTYRRKKPEGVVSCYSSLRRKQTKRKPTVSVLCSKYYGTYRRKGEGYPRFPFDCGCFVFGTKRASKKNPEGWNLSTVGIRNEDNKPSGFTYRIPPGSPLPSVVAYEVLCLRDSKDRIRRKAPLKKNNFVKQELSKKPSFFSFLSDTSRANFKKLKILSFLITQVKNVYISNKVSAVAPLPLGFLLFRRKQTNSVAIGTNPPGYLESLSERKQTTVGNPPGSSKEANENPEGLLRSRTTEGICIADLLPSVSVAFVPKQRKEEPGGFSYRIPTVGDKQGRRSPNQKRYTRDGEAVEFKTIKSQKNNILEIHRKNNLILQFQKNYGSRIFKKVSILFYILLNLNIFSQKNIYKNILNIVWQELSQKAFKKSLIRSYKILQPLYNNNNISVASLFLRKQKVYKGFLNNWPILNCLVNKEQTQPSSFGSTSKNPSENPEGEGLLSLPTWNHKVPKDTKRKKNINIIAGIEKVHKSIMLNPLSKIMCITKQESYALRAYKASLANKPQNKIALSSSPSDMVLLLHLLPSVVCFRSERDSKEPGGFSLLWYKSNRKQSTCVARQKEMPELKPFKEPGGFPFLRKEGFTGTKYRTPTEEQIESSYINYLLRNQFNKALKNTEINEATKMLKDSFYNVLSLPVMFSFVNVPNKFLKGHKKFTQLKKQKMQYLFNFIEFFTLSSKKNLDFIYLKIAREIARLNFNFFKVKFLGTKNPPGSTKQNKAMHKFASYFYLEQKLNNIYLNIFLNSFTSYPSKSDKGNFPFYALALFSKLEKMKPRVNKKWNKGLQETHNPELASLAPGCESLVTPQIKNSLVYKIPKNKKPSGFSEQLLFNNSLNEPQKLQVFYNGGIISEKKTKKLYNTIYCLSHRERWEVENDWNFLFYFFSSSRDNLSEVEEHVIANYTEIKKTPSISTLYLESLSVVPKQRKQTPTVRTPFFIKGTYKEKEFINYRYGNINYRQFFFKNPSGFRTEPKSFNFKGSGIEEVFNSRQTELLNQGACFSGPGIVQQLLNEFNFYEIKKMDKQNRILLYQLNKQILKLKKLKTDRYAKKELKESYKKRDLLIRRTKLVRKLFIKESSPQATILTVLPVLPADLRPIVKMGGQIAASDLNRLYQRVIYRNDRLKKFLKDPATSHSYEMKYAQRLLQEAVDNLIQNGKSGVVSEKDSRGRALKSLSDILKGKQGRFRQYLLGKRVDYSGRSVIVVGPKLKLHECGIPKEMALELYLPFLLKRILNSGAAKTVVGAKTLIKTNPSLIWELLREIMQTCPVLLNRAPTLHRLGIQAFQPKLIDGRAILLHPLVCSAFNADFDGDQMAVHIPITVEARAEAWKLMLSRNSILSPATGDPLAIPSQDMVLGCYYLTTNLVDNRRLSTYTRQKKGSGFYFSTIEEALKDFELQKIELHANIWLKWKAAHENEAFFEEPVEIRLDSYGNWKNIYNKSQKSYNYKNNFSVAEYILTTPGKILFNQIINKILFFNTK